MANFIFFFGGQFGQSFLERSIEKNRVIAKSVLASGLKDYPAAQLPSIDFKYLAPTG